MKKSARAKSRPRAIQTSRHLHVVPRKHTGHLLARRHTSYATLAMIVLCVGVLLASWTHWVTADPIYGPASGSYTVNVRVPGPAPSQPATITSTNGIPVVPHLTVKSLPLTAAGNCPVNTYEVLYRNNVMSGVALCSPTGTYSIQTDLFSGLNQIQVRDFSLTDVPGPVSNIINVTYEPPAQPSTPQTSNSSAAGAISKAATAPLILKTNFAFQGYFRGESAPLDLSVEGGTPPYAIDVSWGDGQRSLASRAVAGEFTLEHKYQKAGGYKGSYPVIVTASDATGRQTYLQLLSIINNPPAAAAGSTTTPPTISLLTGTPDWLRHVVRYIWPGYGILLLMLTSFWLGERRELHALRPGLRRTRRRTA